MHYLLLEILKETHYVCVLCMHDSSKLCLKSNVYIDIVNGPDTSLLADAYNISYSYSLRAGYPDTRIQKNAKITRKSYIDIAQAMTTICKYFYYPYFLNIFLSYLRLEVHTRKFFNQASAYFLCRCMTHKLFI